MAAPYVRLIMVNVISLKAVWFLNGNLQIWAQIDLLMCLICDF
ncbi:hypothetical protein T08_11688 [Trichinella sp. T8]|nr:hypothetical protein T08_11688 [Trichinella sp. T8]